jgi:hypothetical protein
LLKLWHWLREHLVKAEILAALTASATTYLKGVFDSVIGDVLPKGAEISCAGREWIAGHWPFRQPEAPSDIFVATLTGDDASGTQTQTIKRAFQGQRAFDVIPACRVLDIPVRWLNRRRRRREHRIGVTGQTQREYPSSRRSVAERRGP